MSSTADTIFALATGPTQSAIAIFRVSGRETAAVLKKLAGETLPAPRRLVRRLLRSCSGDVLDDTLVAWFPAPGSYTGEDCAELHCHGGRAVRDAIADALLALGVRPAEAGEFSRRGYLAGKSGLLEMEAIADLVAAETETQRRQALSQAAGEGTRRIEALALRVRESLARAEAEVDFPDEVAGAEGDNSLAGLERDIACELKRARNARRVRDGVSVAVIGAPNVGKSSLVNALAGRDVSITSPLPGTTRDAIETTIVLAGVPVFLIDTAGLRDTIDPIEAEGVRRARLRAESADIRLTIVEAGHDQPLPLAGQADLIVANKVDLAQPASGALGVSAMLGTGIEELRQVLEQAVATLASGGGLSHARHEASLSEARCHIRAAHDAIAPEIRAEHLRLALRALGRITGETDVEAVLDLVFGQFCIGK